VSADLKATSLLKHFQITVGWKKKKKKKKRKKKKERKGKVVCNSLKISCGNGKRGENVTPVFVAIVFSSNSNAQHSVSCSIWEFPILSYFRS